MTQTPAGWYPDPAPVEPGRPSGQRWWDGSQWTEHVQPTSFVAQPVAMTPDGQQLAGWWQRVAAFLVDSLVLVTISVAVGWPFVHRIGHVYADYFDRVLRASENGTTVPSQSGLLGDIFLPLLGYVAVSLVVSLVYNAGFLKTLQATPGKLAVGLRVRLRERPGPLPWRAVLLRWLVANVATLASVVPVVGALAGFFPVIDLLWPLWDQNKQALHDKAAGTNVVRRAS